MRGPPSKHPASRLLIIDPRGCVLLFRFVFDHGPLAGRAYWPMPGGALEEGETFAMATERELAEETGIVAPVGAEFRRKLVRFQIPSGQIVDADERYFVVAVSDRTVHSDGRTTSEDQYIKEHRWWLIGDLNSTSETVFPEELAIWLDAAIQNGHAG